MPEHLVPESLVFGYGNPSRGDDALGPAIIERLRDQLGARGRGQRVELLTDYQLQPEHALDLRGRSRVLFVDSSSLCAEPCQMKKIVASPGATVFTHALAPQALLSVYQRIEGSPPPACWLLAIRGYAFELGEALSAHAAANLEAALREVTQWVAQPEVISLR